jgi:hypothetical protein
MVNFSKLFFIIIIVFGREGLAQSARISGVVITKERLPTGHFKISKGKVYYDLRFRKLLIDINYPIKEKWVSVDTLLYHFSGDKFKEKTVNITTPETSIFHIALSGQITNYGLKKSFYQIEKVEREGGRVYVTWAPDSRLKSLLGKVKLSQYRNRLEGVIFFGVKGEIIAKHFFRKYKNINGIDFPEEVVFVSIRGGKEYYQIMTYKDIAVNDFKNDAFYNYQLPN